MKKITTILFSILMMFSLTACAGGNKSTVEKTSGTGKQAENLSVGNDSADNTLPESTSETTQGNEQTTGGAEWLSGKRLNGGSSQSEIAEWINGLGLGVTAQ